MILTDEVARTAPLDALFRAHHSAMLKYARKRCQCADEAQDAVMDALLRIAPHLVDVAPAAHPAYWRRAILNRIIEMARRRNLIQMLSIEASEEIAQENGEAAPAFMAEEEPVYTRPENRLLQNTVREAVMKLSDDHREVVVRFYFAEQDIEEISQGIGRPGGTVKSRLGRARGALHRPLKEGFRR